MKKLLMASLLGVIAIFGASASEEVYTHNPNHWRVRMDSNPLYRPLHDRWYSLTDLNVNEKLDYFKLTENLGYGISDRWSVWLTTMGSYDSADYPRYGVKMSWDNFGIGTNFRYVDRGPWIADLYGQVQQNYDKFGGSRYNEFETYAYNWTLGTKFGYVGWNKWTVAFTVQVDYQKDDIPEMDWHAWGLDLGVDALWNFTPHWNIVGGLHYGVDMNSTDGFSYYYDNPLFAKVGLDYNFTDWTYLGVYVGKDIAHSSDKANNNRPSQWNFGAKFGIDF